MAESGEKQKRWLISQEDTVLVTGAPGFVGTAVVAALLNAGVHRVRCLVRPSSDCRRLQNVLNAHVSGRHVEIVRGNLLAAGDCLEMTRGVSVVYHLAAGTGTKSFADAFLNSVVTTRNLLEACLQHRCLKRFVSASSFSVYSNRNNPRGRLLDESCPLEDNPTLRGDAYCFAKLQQDEIVTHYAAKHSQPCVLVRPGVVYGPGKTAISGRVGRDTFGVYLHLGGPNRIPLTYVENCADAIVLAGLVPGVDGEVFNLVDDDLPSSRRFLRLYKSEVRHFRSIYVPRFLSHFLCHLWERYSLWSQGQLPLAFNTRAWHAYWKGSVYTNDKLKRLLGWSQKVPTDEGLRRFFESCREKESHA